MKNIDKSKEELFKELNNLHTKQSIAIDLHKKDLADYKKDKPIFNSNPDSQEAEIQRLISEHQVILIELELMIQELAFQNEEKEKRAKELAIANIELAFQNKEKEKRANELAVANVELAFQNKEKEKRAEELALANVELAFQNKEKIKRARELVTANSILAFENEEKAKKTEDLVAVYNALIKQKQRLDVILEISHSGTWGYNIKTGETIFNERWATMIGYTLEEISPITIETCKKFTHPEDKKKSDLILQKYFKGEVDFYECESRMKHKNGQWIWVLDRGKVNEWDENGNMLMMSGIHEDITQRKIAEIKLQESEHRYRSLVEWSPETIIVHRDGKIIYVNPAAVKTFKEDSIDDLLGKPIFDWIHPDSHAATSERIKTLVNIGDMMPTVELKLIAQDRSIIYVESHALVINYDGKPAVQYSIRDISNKKELENLLAKANKIARLGAIELNLCNYSLYFSKITKEILEVENDFEIGLDNAMSFFNLDEQRNKILTAIKKGIETEEKWELELKIRTAKGNDSWVKIIGETEFLNGNPIRVNGSFQDINERKLTQIALQENRKELEDYKFALDELAIVAITDENGIIKTVNDNFCRISQFSKEELIGNTHKIINSNYHSKAFFEEMWKTISSGNIWRGMVKNKKKNNEYYWLDSTFIPFMDANNKPFQYLAIRYDVSEIKNAEEEIIKAKEHAEENDRLKSAFLANMSHEIRTPMNGILGFTNLLKDINLSREDQQEYIKIIDESGIRLLSIINDIIDISKIESKQMKVFISETNINEQIESIYNFFKPEVTNKGLDFSFENGLSTNEAFIDTDSGKVYATLINLVKNSIKFCDKGNINFGYKLKDNNGTSELEFYVKDSGIGIPNDRLKAIFDRFIQADISDKRAFQGAGLGLSISRAYVEMLGGKIWVESEVGIGSSFYFTIPYNTEPKRQTIAIKNTQKKEPIIQIKKLKILIVEDDSISKLLISKAISPLSKEILHANSGIEAIESCRNNPDIDLVMMDVNMPEMSGHEATKIIRQFNKDIIIIEIGRASSMERVSTPV